jgi:hypothetical protein
MVRPLQKVPISARVISKYFDVIRAVLRYTTESDMAFLRKALKIYTPKRFGEATYTTAVKAFQLAIEISLRDSHAQVWTRNGYKGTDWVPFVQPVDFSVWFAREPSVRDLNSVRDVYRRVKKVFPVLGEMNVYVATDIDLFSQLMNPFLLEQDPTLKKKLILKNKVSERAQASAYLFRILDSEVKAVLEESDETQRRWGGYFLSVGKVFDNDREFEDWLNLTEGAFLKKVIGMAVGILGPPADKKTQADILECLELYYESIGRNVPGDILRPLLQNQPSLWAVFPHRLCYESREPKQLKGLMTGAWAELAVAGISWELSRILSSVRLLGRGRRIEKNEEMKRATIRAHLDSIEEFMALFLSPTLKECAHSEIMATTIGRIRKIL